MLAANGFLLLAVFYIQRNAKELVFFPEIVYNMVKNAQSLVCFEPSAWKGINSMENFQEISIGAKARILIDALPYMQKYYGQTIVVKFGESAMADDQLCGSVMRDVVLLSLVGIRVVVVHGGGSQVGEMLSKLGKEMKMIDQTHYADAEAADIAQMVIAGRINKNLVALLNHHGGRALGLCGMDAGMISPRLSDESNGWMAAAEDIHVAPIADALNCGYIPVIAAVSCDASGAAYQLDEDLTAAKIAAALHAKNFLLMTDHRGLLKEENDPNTLMPVVKVRDVPALTKKGIVREGMLAKVDCCVEAVRRGVQHAFMIDGRLEHALLIELFSNEGTGTMFEG